MKVDIFFIVKKKADILFILYGFIIDECYIIIHEIWIYELK